MKKILANAILPVLVGGILLFSQISCTKEDNTPTPTTSLTKEQILTQKTWRIDQLHSVINGTYASYYSGGTNTTGKNYDVNRYTFNTDGTGAYINENGDSYTAAWEFTSSDKRTLKFTINVGGVPKVNTWEMVEIAGTYLHGSQNFTVGTNTDNLHSFRLIQIP